MRDREREAWRWLLQAENDLAFADLGLREGFFAQACFYSQQAAEKGLKALAYYRGDRVVLGALPHGAGGAAAGDVSLSPAPSRAGGEAGPVLHTHQVPQWAPGRGTL